MSATNGVANTDKAARRQRFEDVFPVIAEELLGYVRGEGMPLDAVEWFEKVSYGIAQACQYSHQKRAAG
jgi:hypothetical protein